jgi:hypothetical protein
LAAPKSVTSRDCALGKHSKMSNCGSLSEAVVAHEWRANNSKQKLSSESSHSISSHTESLKVSMTLPCHCAFSASSPTSKTPSILIQFCKKLTAYVRSWLLFLVFIG